MMAHGIQLVQNLHEFETAAPPPRWSRLAVTPCSAPVTALLDAVCDAAVAQGYGVFPRAYDASLGPTVLGVTAGASVGPYRLDMVVQARFFGEALDLCIDVGAEPPLRGDCRGQFLAAMGYSRIAITAQDIEWNAPAYARLILDVVMDFQTEAVERAARKTAD